MGNQGIEPTVGTYKILVDASLAARDISKVEAMFDDKDEEITGWSSFEVSQDMCLELEVYECYISKWLADRMHEAENLLHIMIENGVRPKCLHKLISIRCNEGGMALEARRSGLMEKISRDGRKWSKIKSGNLQCYD